MQLGIWIFASISIISISTVAIYSFRKKYEVKLYGSNGPSKKNKLLKDILNTAFSKKSLQESCEVMTEKLKGYFGMEYISLFTRATEDDCLHLVATNTETMEGKLLEQYFSSVFKNEILKMGADRNAGIIECSKETYLPYPTAESRGIKYSYIAPLSAGTEIIGALLVESTKYEPRNLTQQVEHEFFRTILNYVSVAFQALLYHQKIQHVAWYDALTGIHNRAFMLEDLSLRMKGAQESGQTFGVAIFDIDKFKSFNDTHGHAVGDKVLKAVSQRVKASLRSCDEVYRYGGEEFVIYIHDLTPEECFQYIDQVRKDVQEMVVEKDDGTVLKVTSSFGIANYPLHSQDLDKLHNFADKALYESKNSGRNKVTLYTATKEGKEKTIDA